MRPFTTGELKKIINDTLAGVNYREIAERVGRSHRVVYDVIRKNGLKPAFGKKPGATERKDYTVYDREWNLIAFGTASECANAIGIKRSSFFQYLSRQRHNGRKSPFIIVEEENIHNESDA